MWWKVRLEPRSGRWVFFVPLEGDSPIESARRVLGVCSFMGKYSDLVKVGDRPAGLRSLGTIRGVEVFQDAA